MTEAYGTVPQMTKYYGKVMNGEIIEYGAQIPFNFLFTFLQHWTNSSEFIENIEAWISSMPKGVGIQANWVVSIVLPIRINVLS